MNTANAEKYTAHNHLKTNRCAFLSVQDEAQVLLCQLLVDQKPVRIYMIFPMPLIFAFKRMIFIFRVKRFIIPQLSDNRIQLLHIKTAFHCPRKISVESHRLREAVFVRHGR